MLDELYYIRYVLRVLCISIIDKVITFHNFHLPMTANLLAQYAERVGTATKPSMLAIPTM